MRVVGIQNSATTTPTNHAPNMPLRTGHGRGGLIGCRDSLVYSVAGLPCGDVTAVTIGANRADAGRVDGRVRVLGLVALAALSARPVCRPEGPGDNEWRLGVRHERLGGSWQHCEPWIRHALGS